MSNALSKSTDPRDETECLDGPDCPWCNQLIDEEKVIADGEEHRMQCTECGNPVAVQGVIDVTWKVTRLV